MSRLKRPLRPFRSSGGSVLVEFALSFLLYVAFLYGLIALAMWGIGGSIVQDVANEAARKYAVTADPAAAQRLARTYLGRWAYVFVDPSSVQVTVSRSGDAAHAVVTAQPRIQKAFFYAMPALKREASCTMEYRFRRPGEFL